MAHWDDEAVVQQILGRVGRDIWTKSTTNPLQLAHEILGAGSVETYPTEEAFCSRHYLYVPEHDADDLHAHQRNVAQALCVWELAFGQGIAPYVGWNIGHLGAALEMPVLSFLPVLERRGSHVSGIAHELDVSVESVMHRLEALGVGASSMTISGFISAVRV